MTKAGFINKFIVLMFCALLFGCGSAPNKQATVINNEFVAIPFWFKSKAFPEGERLFVVAKHDGGQSYLIKFSLEKGKNFIFVTGLPEGYYVLESINKEFQKKNDSYDWRKISFSAVKGKVTVVSRILQYEERYNPSRNLEIFGLEGNEFWYYFDLMDAYNHENQWDVSWPDMLNRMSAQEREELIGFGVVKKNKIDSRVKYRITNANKI